MTNYYHYIMRDRIVYWTLKHHLMEGDVLYDVGCHNGRYSLPFIKTCKVYGFEPNPGKKQKKFQLFQVALGKENKVAKLYSHKKDFYNSLQELALQERFGGKTKIINAYYVDVKVVTLDGFIKERRLRPPTIIKIDVQGGEYDVLIGAYQTISRYKPVLVIEVHTKLIKYFGYSYEELKDLLTKLNYTFTVLKVRNDDLHLLAKTK